MSSANPLINPDFPDEEPLDPDLLDEDDSDFSPQPAQATLKQIAANPSSLASLFFINGHVLINSHVLCVDGVS